MTDVNLGLALIGFLAGVLVGARSTRRIVREELNEAAKRIVSNCAGQRAQLMTGCVRP